MNLFKVCQGKEERSEFFFLIKMCSRLHSTLALNPKFHINIHKCTHRRSGNLVLKLTGLILLKSPVRSCPQTLDLRKTKTKQLGLMLLARHLRVQVIRAERMPFCSQSYQGILTPVDNPGNKRQHSTIFLYFQAYFSVFE